MTIARRMWIASAVLAVLVAAAFGVLLLAVSAQREATDREARSKDVTVATLRLEKLVVDIGSGIRGFAVTRAEALLDPYIAARDELPERRAELLATVADDPQQRARARRLSRLISQYVNDYAEPLVSVTRRSPDAARQREVADEGRVYTDGIRSLFRTLLATENGAAEQASELADRRAEQAIVYTDRKSVV